MKAIWFPKLEVDRALEIVYRDSPELRAAEVSVRQSEAGVRRAQAEKIPDIFVRGGLRNNREFGEVGPLGPTRRRGLEGIFDVSVEIPIFNRNQGGVKAARAEAEHTRLEVQRTKLTRLAAEYKEYRDAAIAVERYRNRILPKARQAYDLYLANFRQMAGAYPQALIAQRNLFQFQDDYVAALVNVWQHAVAIEGRCSAWSLYDGRTMNKFRYEEFTWPEVKHAVAANRVAVLPVGTVEQHGPHLPLVTDVLTATEMSRMAVERIAEEAVLMPSVYYSFNEHHMDFPGTIAVAGETIVRYVTDIGVSLARHGFRKILIVNGHGSNVPFLDIAARNISNTTEAVAAMASWWSLIPKELVTRLRESEYPGGMAHGCELETSVLLHLRPDLVQMDKAQKDIHFQHTEFFYWDLQNPSPIFFQEWFSRYSKTGTVGDPTKARAEKGAQFVEAVVGRMVSLIQEFRAREIRPRVDHH